MSGFEPFDPERARRIALERSGLEGPLLPVLQALQATFGCVPPEAIAIVAEELGLSRAEVHGVASFYHDFRTAPGGRRLFRLCRAESCQARGGEAVWTEVLAALEIGWGETTADGAVTVEGVFCLGLCAVSPAALADGRPVGRADAATLLRAVRS